MTWGRENRSQLIRVPASDKAHQRAELRSPDPLCDPYLAYAMIVWAALDGIRSQLALPAADERNMYALSAQEAAALEVLPRSLEEARALARKSAFVRQHLPEGLIR